LLLHHHKNFKDLIAAVSDDMAISPTLVEKDYWNHALLVGIAAAGLYV